MKWTKTLVAELIAVLAMAGAVCTLAIMQYDSADEIGRVEHDRLKASLAASVRDFDQEFSYDFQRLCESFEVDTGSPTSNVESRILREYDTWMRTTSNPGFLSGLDVWKYDGHASLVESLDSRNLRFQETSWPARLAPTRLFLEQQFAKVSGTVDDRDALYYPWSFYEDHIDGAHDALIRPIFQVFPKNGKSTSDGGSESSSEVQPVGFLIVELSPKFLREQYLPGLVERHFGRSGLRSFAVAVRTGQVPHDVLYVSEPDFALDAQSGHLSRAPDESVNLFDVVSEEARRRGHPPLQAGTASGQWQLVAQHPAGSVELAVTRLRRRSLTTGFGLLSILAGSVVLILSVARRAERMANAQMEFVAGISHELCTPLAVINAAAENLLDGVVDNPSHVREYAAMIRDHGRRLERLVDEVLVVSAGRAERSRLELRPVEIAATVMQSLLLSEPMLRDAGFAIEREIGADLPLVVADPDAVGKCMENLFSNAVKYASASRWLAIRARLVPALPRPEVQVSVEDKGMGIPAADLPNIFDPFYRVQAVRDGQVRGMGLGLYLVKKTMESMGGSVSVSSEPGRGTFFTLHFPVSSF